MRLLLIHLSDIHITNEEDTITKRYPQIVNAVKNLDYSLDLCVVVVTGDIAYSGTTEQYIVAFEFFENIQHLLSENLSGPTNDQPVPVHFVIVPGNHDCDFTASGALRDIIANSILEDISRTEKRDIVQTCTAVQDPFFDFLDAVEPLPRIPSGEAYDVRLSYKYDLTKDDENVSFLCYNTAWLSQLHETQGRLYFPAEAVRLDQEESTLIVASFHHPYNWLESNAARAFRGNIESIADLVLTGHEHTTSYRAQEGGLGQRNIYVEGGVLQDSSDPTTSEFNVFVFDTIVHRKKYAHFRWKDGSYSLTTQSSLGDDGSGLGWTDYRTNGHRAIDKGQLSDVMRMHLDDPGLSLRHRDRGFLKLSDVFVYPDLVEVKIRGERLGERITGDHLVELLESAPRLVITGGTESGKTSLAKMLYADLLANGVIPVLLDGDRRPPRGDRVYGYIEQVFSEQYSDNLLEAYRQSDISRRALIVDDYDKLPLTSIQKKQFLAALSSSVRYLIVLSHDLTSDLEELSNPGGLSGSAEDIVHYRLQPLGYVGRSKLVERWMLLSESVDPAHDTFVRQLHGTTDTLNTLIGKNYVPSYPVYVLSVLQALDSATPIDITASTHGYFYELFIRTTLARGRNRRDFDIIANYLAFLSYQMHQRRTKVVSEGDLKAIHEDYEDRYDISRPFGEMIRQLVDQGILTRLNDEFRFKYSYLFNYFVASYLRDHITEPTIRNVLGDVARNLHIEDNANILLFLAHLSKDPIILNELLSASRCLYPAYRPAELNEDIDFMGHLLPGLPEAVYEGNDPRMNREAMLTEMDRESLPDTGIDELTPGEGDSDLDVEDPIVQFVTALRHLEILGQVLKNFPGSLEGSTKLDIGRECFHLGLRTLSVVLQMVRAEQSEILSDMSQAIRLRHPSMVAREVDSRARESLIGMIHMLSYGLIRCVSRAVGSRDLFSTYERLLEESPTPAFALINSALNIDNNSEFPHNLVKRVGTEFSDAPLPLSVLRHLVVAHFHLFPVDFKIKQSISSAIGIKYPALQRVNPRAKMLPRPGSVRAKQS